MNRVCFTLTPASADMIRPRLDLVEHTLANFWTHQKQARILCHARSVSFTARLAAMIVPEDWRRRYLLEQRAVYQHLEASFVRR